MLEFLVSLRVSSVVICGMSGPLSMFNYFAIRLALGFLLICGEDRCTGAPGSPEVRPLGTVPGIVPKHSQSKVKQSKVK